MVGRGTGDCDRARRWDLVCGVVSGRGCARLHHDRDTPRLRPAAPARLRGLSVFREDRPAALSRRVCHRVQHDATGTGSMRASFRMDSRAKRADEFYAACERLEGFLRGHSALSEQRVEFSSRSRRTNPVFNNRIPRPPFSAGYFLSFRVFSCSLPSRFAQFPALEAIAGNRTGRGSIRSG